MATETHTRFAKWAWSPKKSPEQWLNNHPQKTTKFKWRRTHKQREYTNCVWGYTMVIGFSILRVAHVFCPCGMLPAVSFISSNHPWSPGSWSHGFRITGFRHSLKKDNMGKYSYISCKNITCPWHIQKFVFPWLSIVRHPNSVLTIFSMISILF